MLLKDQSHEVISESVVKAFDHVEASGDFAINLEEFTKNTLVTKDFDIYGFVGLVKGIGMQFDQLYIAYVGKNVLNFFRQDHGYQDGSYHKQWGGKEDNEHLVEIVGKLDTNLPTFKDDLYSEMKAVYQQLCA